MAHHKPSVNQPSVAPSSLHPNESDVQLKSENPVQEEGAGTPEYPNNGKSPYPYGSKGEKLKRKEKKGPEKKASVAQRFLPFIKFLLALVWLTTACFTLAIMWEVIRHNLYMTVKWDLYKEPVNFKFTNFSVSSSSETCNEYMRSFYLEGHKIESLAVAMMLCLSTAEPQASGFGGSSVLVFSNSTNCFQSSGNARLPIRLKPFYDELTKTTAAEWTGPYSTAIPGDIRSYLAAIELADKNDLEIVLKKLKNEFKGVKFPVSRRLGETLNKWTIGMAMTARELFGNYKTSEGDFLNEGDLFSPYFQEEIVKALLGNDVSAREKMEKEIFTQLVREMSSQDGSSYIDEMKKIRDKTALSQGYFKEIKGTGMSVCSAFNKDIVESAPLVPSVLREMTKEKLAKISQKDLIETISKQEFYDLTTSLTAKIWKEAAKIGKKKNTKISGQGTSEREQYMPRLENIAKNNDWEVPQDGNSFVMVDHNRNVAFAMSATLGTSFGSLVSGMKDREMVMLNNLMAGTGRDLLKEGNLRHAQEPVIIMNKGKVKTAYAANGGFIAYSLEAPRKLTSLLLSLFWDIPLKTALTTPLFYHDKQDHLQATHNLPSVRFGKLGKSLTKEKLDENHKQLDTVVAIDGKTAIYFNGQKEEIVIVPNGV